MKLLIMLSIVGVLIMLSGAALGQGGPPGTPPGHGGDVPGQGGPNVPGDPGFEFPGGGNVNPPPFNGGGGEDPTDPGGGNGNTDPGENGNDVSSGFGFEGGLSGLEIAPEAPLTLPQTGGSTTMAAVLGLLLTTGGVLLAKLKIG